MADEYVPTTREMESAYVCDSLGTGIDEAEARRQFSRYLAALDAEIREQIAREIDTRANQVDGEDYTGGAAYTSGVRYGLTIAAAVAGGAS